MSKQEHQEAARKSALEQLRAKFKDNPQLPDQSDEYLLNWLIVKNYDVTQAEKGLLQTLEWRRVNKMDEVIDTLKDSDFPILKKFYTLETLGRDKMDGPFVWLAPGKVDLKGIMQSMTKKEFLRYYSWKVEGIARELYLANKPNSPYKKTGNQGTLLFDMDGLSMKVMAYKPAVQVMLEQFQILETHYPNSVRRIFFINGSKLFGVLFNLVKPFLNKTTADAVKIFGSNKAEWVPALLQEIDADQLPAYYGGTMTDPDGNPKCPSKLNLDPEEVPKSLYLANNKPVPKDGMTAITVSSGSKKKLEFHVNAVGSSLRWEFMTEGGDIAFRIYCKNSKDGIEEIVTTTRVESNWLMEEGEITCDFAGTYVFEFDNSFSYFTAKKIHFSIVVDQHGASAN